MFFFSQVAKEDPLLAQCKGVKCRAGRECRVLSSGTAECVCMRECPKRSHPICGSNGIAYENHCELHREACLKGIHIHPVFGQISCQDDPMAKLKREVEKSMDEIRKKENMKIKVPSKQHFCSFLRSLCLKILSQSVKPFHCNVKLTFHLLRRDDLTTIITRLITFPIKLPSFYQVNWLVQSD